MTATTIQPSLPTTLATPDIQANPYPTYALLREHAPVHRVVLPLFSSVYLVTRYDDVVAILKDDKRFVKNKYRTWDEAQLKKKPWMPGMFKPLEKNMLDLDDPDHARLRTLVHKAFTPKLIEQMRDQVQHRADELLDKVQAQGRMDLIADFALPLPLTIIGDILGIPRQDMPTFSKWSKSFLTITSDASTMNILRVIPNLWWFTRYLKQMFRDRKVNPHQDLTTALVQAEEQGDKLNEDELLAMVFLLLIAGHETTVNLIGTGTLALLEHRDQFELFRNDPGVTRTAIEELLRYTAPVEQATERFALEDVEVRGVKIRKGELVMAGIGSANRDPSVFANPEALDLTRDPNRHVSFGLAGHYCLGAPLARLEGTIAFNTLLRRLPNLKLATSVDKLRWRNALVMRGLETLPLTF